MGNKIDSKMEKYLCLNGDDTVELCKVCCRVTPILASRTEVQHCKFCGAITTPCTMCDLGQPETPYDVCSPDKCPVLKLWGLDGDKVSDHNISIYKQLKEKGYYDD